MEHIILTFLIVLIAVVFFVRKDRNLFKGWKYKAPHPGEILREEYYTNSSLSHDQFIHLCNMDERRFNKLINEDESFTASDCRKISKATNKPVEYWVELCISYDQAQYFKRTGR